jgi:GTP pyrophosphokinase
VYSVAAGGTPLDFAYQVHTDVGNHCVGAKINGRIVPLDYQLQNGDICEILVNKSSGRPSLDWLSVVNTSSAKHKIKQWFRKERREENVLAGQEALEQELARAGLRTDLARGELIERIASRLNYSTPTDLYAAIGFGDASAQAVANRVRDEIRHDNVVDFTKIGRKPTVRRSVRRASGVRIAGVDDVLVRLSKCCSPVPGDPIMGYVTIGRGVSVHRADCPNVAYMNATPERILQAQWLDADLTHSVDVEVEAEDRSQLLQDIMAVFSELKTQVSSVNARVRKDGAAVASLTVQIRDLSHLHKLLTKLETLKNVRRVYRVTKRERTAL